MEALNLPDYSQCLRVDRVNKTIYDPIRNKHLVLTPEEWVRQNFIAHMVFALHYPKGLIAVEMPICLNGLSRRCDIVGFDKTGSARIIVECKATSVKISQKTFDQIATYNLKLKVDYLIVTNGYSHFCCKMDYTGNSYCFLEEIPDYEAIALIS